MELKVTTGEHSYNKNLDGKPSTRINVELGKFKLYNCNCQHCHNYRIYIYKYHYKQWKSVKYYFYLKDRNVDIEKIMTTLAVDLNNSKKKLHINKYGWWRK